MFWFKLILLFGGISLFVNCGGNAKKARTSSTSIPTEDLSADANGAGLNDNKDYGKLSEDDLMKLSLAELELVLEERKNQNVSEQDELELLDALNTALCLELDKLRSNCKMAVRIIPDGNERELKCSGNYSTVSNVEHKFEVAIPSNLPGQYYFTVNDTYQSTPFAAGRSTIKFKAIGSAAILAPQLKQIYRMVVKPVQKDASIPTPKDFNLQFYVDGVLLVKSALLPSDDRATKDTMLRINLVELQQIARGASCMVSDAQIQALKTSVSTSVKQGQAQKRKQNYIKKLDGAGEVAK